MARFLIEPYSLYNYITIGKCNLKLLLLVTIIHLVVFVDVTSPNVIHRIRSGCELITNGDWSPTQALILNEEMTKIVHPEFQDSVLFSSTERFVLACPGSQLSLQEETEAVATCRRGTQVEINQEGYEFESMSCERLPQTSARAVGKRCLESTVNGIQLEIGFDVDTNFIKLIDICFDDRALATVYSHYVATPKIVGRQHGFPRRLFQDAGFYHGIKVWKLYSRYVQRRTISRILGSDQLGERYIQNDTLHYLARGHLSAKADFIYGSEQMGTFYYINVAPQWQIINAGNWASLEESVRDHVVDTGTEISVYTLAYGVAVLPDINETLQELYLCTEDSGCFDESDAEDYDDQQPRDLIPVPKFYIKILYHEDTKKGIAFVTINNPYLEEITADYLLCEDICDKYPWLTWNQTNIQLGYSYCCSYEDLKVTVKTLPELPIEDLL